MTQILGALLVALPFLALFAYIIWTEGWADGLLSAAVVFGGTAAVVAVVYAGAYLLGMPA